MPGTSTRCIDIWTLIRLAIDEHTLLRVVRVGNELRMRPVKMTESCEVIS